MVQAPVNIPFEARLLRRIQKTHFPSAKFSKWKWKKSGPFACLGLNSVAQASLGLRGKQLHASAWRMNHLTMGILTSKKYELGHTVLRNTTETSLSPHLVTAGQDKKSLVKKLRN